MKTVISSEAGTTLAEIMVSVLLMAGFLASIFEVNAVCLRYVEATKETVAGIQTANDRLEALRNVAFTNLISQNYMTTTTGVDTAGNPLPGNGTPAPGMLVATADTSSFSKNITETITLTDYSTGIPGSISVTYTRTPGASSTPTVSWSGGTSFPSTTTMVKANVTVSWNMTFGGRARTQQAETIIAAGQKK